MEPASLVKIKRQNINGKSTIVQDCDVYIGRSLNMGGWNLTESKWHNPFKINKGLSETEARKEVCKKYEKYLRSKDMDYSELLGKKLGCWCSPKQCHGDIIIKIMKEKYLHVGTHRYGKKKRLHYWMLK